MTDLIPRLGRRDRTLLGAGLTALSMVGTFAQPSPVSREFSPNTLRALDQLPGSRFRSQLEQLPPEAQGRALQWLRSFHFTEHDLPSLHADREGGIFYVCKQEALDAGDSETLEPPPISRAAVPVNPFPDSLVFHSLPGAPNVLYLNFAGETVVNTVWNTELGRSEVPATPFSADSDLTTYSDSEQLAIKRIWQRVAEDYAPFNIDVTTERPSTFGTRTAHALITRNTDANGDPNPASTAGGVAYVNVFGTTSYAKYRPAWIYHNNLGNVESYVAEGATHEIGHNLGLTHDGKTDGTEYYGGHGSGDVSWGPIMGTGYNRNVSQWSKGEYYLANNTQDDLATIAGKLSYRTDDHGNTAGTATPLILSNGTNIVSTTPETDPVNTQTANKGLLERNTDLDVFSFVTGNGPVRIAVNPWIMLSGTKGGNADIQTELKTEAGSLLITNNPATTTTSLIETNLPAGRYYLHVRNSSAGDPFSSLPTGYTAYGSLGQYFISGYVSEPLSTNMPPRAELQISDLLDTGQASLFFTVTYSDDLAVSVSTIDSNDIRVTGPNGYDRLAQFVSLDLSSDGTPRQATYAVDPPSETVWTTADNGTYTLWLEADQVGDTEDLWAAAGELGRFRVSVPVALYYASMDADPDWTLEPDWEFGAPAYSSDGPTGGATGTQILGYNLSGNYPSNLSPKYATTPAIDTSGSTTLTLRFQRWLRTRRSDPAAIQVSTNGTSWTEVWSSTSAIADTSWREVQYTLPTSVAGSSTLRLRWSLASNPRTTDIGWNLDDVALYGDGSLDTTPPVPTLGVAHLTMAGSPSHACSVTYTDETAVNLSSLDSLDLVVIGPNGYSNAVEFIGADLPADGSPITATYSIPAPGEAWSDADNGIYQVLLVDGEVWDTLNNEIPGTTLGSFEIAIPTTTPGTLAVSPTDGLSASGTVGGPFTPASIAYTLANSGGSSLNWTATKTQDWVSLSAAGGTLAAGASTTVTVSINSAASTLTAGSYADSVSFVNTTTGNGNTSRGVALTLHEIVLSLATGDPTPTALALLLNGQPLQTYVIEISGDLTQWTSVATNRADADGLLTYTESDPTPLLQRFYRARTQP